MINSAQLAWTPALSWHTDGTQKKSPLEGIPDPATKTENLKDGTGGTASWGEVSI